MNLNSAIDSNLPLIQSEQFNTSLGAAYYLIKNRKFSLLVGEAGIGKTFLLRYMARSLENIHFITIRANIRIKSLLTAMGDAIGVHTDGSADELQLQLCKALNEAPFHCFLFDECEYLSRHDLMKIDTIRQIWDATKVPIILCGTYGLSDDIKGSQSRGHFSQIFRRLYWIKMRALAQKDVNCYLDLLEKEFAVTFAHDARSELFNHCIDKDNGGLGTFIELIKFSFSIVRPEWKDICFQLEETNMCKPAKTNDHSSKRDYSEVIIPPPPDPLSQNNNTDAGKIDAGKITAELKSNLTTISQVRAESLPHYNHVDIKSLKKVVIDRSTFKNALLYKLTR